MSYYYRLREEMTGHTKQLMAQHLLTCDSNIIPSIIEANEQLCHRLFAKTSNMTLLCANLFLPDQVCRRSSDHALIPICFLH